MPRTKSSHKRDASISSSKTAPSVVITPPAHAKAIARRQKETSAYVTDTASIADPYPLPAAPKVSSIREGWRFPLAVLVSLVVSSVLYSSAATVGKGDLAGVSRRLGEWWQILGLLAWRVVELGVGWWGGFDGVDLASLTLLSHLPPLYLLTAFYNISPLTSLTSLAISILSATLPFRLLRPLSAAHTPSTSPLPTTSKVLLTDIQTRTTTTLLAAAIYALTLYAASLTRLPGLLVTKFAGIHTLEPAYNASFPMLVAIMIPSGFAAREFLFAPAAAAPLTNRGDVVQKAYNPATATLAQKLCQKCWAQLDGRTKVLVKRTALLTAVVKANTVVQVWGTVRGVEAMGAAGWAEIWGLAAVLTGWVFWWVGAV